MPPVREPRHRESVSKPWRERPHILARSVARGAPQRVVHATSCQSVSPSVTRRIRGRSAPPSTAITSADRARIRRRSAASCSGRVRCAWRGSSACPSRPSRGQHGAVLGAVKTSALRAAADVVGASGLDCACAARGVGDYVMATSTVARGLTTGEPLHSSRCSAVDTEVPRR